MRFPEVVPIEKSAPDLEIARGHLGNDLPVNNDGDILVPLQMLLATRRGMRTDSSLATLEIPLDQAIVFSGPSGVEAVRGTPSSRSARLHAYCVSCTLKIKPGLSS
jgi:hypothetical protein